MWIVIISTCSFFWLVIICPSVGHFISGNCDRKDRKTVQNRKTQENRKALTMNMKYIYKFTGLEALLPKNCYTYTLLWPQESKKPRRIAEPGHFRLNALRGVPATVWISTICRGYILHCVHVSGSTDAGGRHYHFFALKLLMQWSNRSGLLEQFMWNSWILSRFLSTGARILILTKHCMRKSVWPRHIIFLFFYFIFIFFVFSPLCVLIFMYFIFSVFLVCVHHVYGCSALLFVFKCGMWMLFFNF